MSEFDSGEYERCKNLSHFLEKSSNQNKQTDHSQHWYN